MVFNGLALGLLETIGFGWISTFLMLVCLYVWKGDFKSSYNYRPKWARVDIPEDVATQIDKDGAKWMAYTIGVFWCALIIGWVYSLLSGDYDHLPFILLASLLGWSLILLAIVVVFYIKAYFAEKKFKANVN
jgi:hypothetical protein